MAKIDDEFLARLRATFRIEAAEHLATLSTGLIQLEQLTDEASRRQVIEQVFRAAHSLKGAARAVDLHDIERDCQALETRFSTWKRGTVTADAAELDSAHRALDRMTAALSGEVQPPPTPPAAEIPQAPAQPAPPPVVPLDDSTVRVSVRALDEHLLGAEELLSVKMTARQRAADVDVLSQTFDEWHKRWTQAQGEMRALGGAPELAEFFEWNHDWTRALESRIATLGRSAEQDRLAVDKLVDDLLENSKKLLMLPFSTTTGLLAKVVRDLARELGKEADLAVRGEDVCVDKRILEEMKDPLVHVLRNCLDHGVELPDVRRKAGKPARASIGIAITQVNGNQVEIAVSDDGAGVDVPRLRARAVEQGLLGADAAAALDEAAVLALVFETEVSTSPEVTRLSGRGLGLAIAREKAEKLGGRVAIESSAGAGTTLRVILPLTLATFRGVLVRVAQRTFVVPTAHVERVTRFRDEDVRTVEGRETLAPQGRALALARLADVLDLPLTPRAESAQASTALIIGTGMERVAFAVDGVVDEREVLVKRLGRPLVRIRNLAGATVLGDGEVAPILDVADLIKSARQRAARAPAALAQPEAARTRRVLVAEDSITSRMLLKGILESAGYEVHTAVDGMDALGQLRTGQFDVLVSDVEMPRLNGFDLTARLRADRQFAELPVILVTALATSDDRARGIDVGANAYLVKNEFENNDLLEALRRLA